MKKFNIGDRVIGISNTAIKPIKGLKGTIIELVSIGLVCVEFDQNIGGHNAARKGKNGHCWVVDVKHLEEIVEKKIVITSDGEETLARLYENGKVVKSATAKCSREDEFDFNIGARLAFDRLTEEEKRFKFKVGDKVVCKSEDLKGMVGTVICIKETEAHYGVEFESLTCGHDCGAFKLLYGSKGKRNHCWWLCTENLEEYKESPYYNGKAVCTMGSGDFTVGKVYEFIDGRTKDDAGNERPVIEPLKKLEDYNGCLYNFIQYVE